MTENKKVVCVADDDGVGYGKPPKDSRFKKGKSGNPRGRKPNSEYLNWNNPVIDVLMENLALKDSNGRAVETPAFVYMLKAMRNNAIKGCHKSFKALADATGGFKALVFELKERNLSRRDDYVRRRMEEARRFVEEELPKWGTK
jgi:Family of unknown function (DUF5681)